jgi:hypothetical protein
MHQKAGLFPKKTHFFCEAKEEFLTEFKKAFKFNIGGLRALTVGEF